jgi:hypothetical protein
MVEEWDEKVREAARGILAHKDEIEELIRLYRNLPIVDVCPFCGYISREPMNRKIKAEVYYRGWPYKDEWITETISFCFCPKCGATPENCKYFFGYVKDGEKVLQINSDDLDKVRAKGLKVMTREYKAAVERIKETLADELSRIEESADEIVYYAPSGEHYCISDMPEDVGRLVMTLYCLIKDPPEMVDEEVI